MAAHTRRKRPRPRATADEQRPRAATDGASPRSPAPPKESRRLLHELRIHQLELEVQNRELREANGVLEASRAHYGELYDRAPVAHFTLDARGRIDAANLSAARLLETEVHRLTGRYFRGFLSTESRRGFDAMLRRRFSTGSSATGRVRLAAGGTPRVVEMVLAPFTQPGDETRICHAAALDVTARAEETKRRARLLRVARAARTVAEQASDMKEQFLAVISHELRTPLGPMLMWLEILQGAGATVDPELRQRAMRGIAACARDQAALIDDLVDMARAAHGKLRIERRPFDLAALVADVIERSSVSAAAKQVTLRQVGSSAPCRTSGDAGRLRQAISNLLSNAIKFSRAGGGVEVCLCSSATGVRLVVSDEGEGISADLLPLIFEPFRQRESRRVRRHGGLGLGLSIARAIVSLHGGDVWAASDGPGRGATFTIALPRRQATPALAPASASAEPPVAPVLSGGGLAGVRVLVVDDHAPTREALAAILARHGAQITVATGAERGRSALGAAPVDVLISDLAMPDEDGYSFIRSVRMAGVDGGAADLPALALTAHARDRELQEALDAGFDQCLVKPVAPRELVSVVAALARRGRVMTARRAQS